MVSKENPSLIHTGTSHADTTVDTVVDALAVERRRRIVRRTLEVDSPIELDDLVEYLAGSADVTTPRATDPDDVALRLYHVDLPRLADADLVDYDREEKRIEATGAAGELRPLLDELDEFDELDG